MTLAVSFLLAAASACSTLSRLQVERVVAVQTGPGVERAGPSYAGCDFDGADVRVSIEVHQISANVTLDEQRKALAAAFPGATFERLTMQQHSAMLMTLPEGAGSQLHILLADLRTYVMVTVLGVADPVAARSLGALVLERVAPKPSRVSS